MNIIIMWKTTLLLTTAMTATVVSATTNDNNTTNKKRGPPPHNTHSDMPPSNGNLFYRNEDLYDIMMTQSLGDKSAARRNLKELSSTQKSNKINQHIMDISPDTQFIPNVDQDTLRKLANSGQYNPNNPYASEMFVDGLEEYNTYSQAWRLLGFMTDCNTNDDEMYQESHHSKDNYEVTQTDCHKYIIWAAYVDLNYGGGGITEYAYCDQDDGQWNYDACSNAGGACREMDCHLSSTEFGLLGFFKHRKIMDGWCEQLFKHEGYCVWGGASSGEDMYEFMEGARKGFPEGCTSSGQTDSSGNLLYYDMKPEYSGGISVGMYSDDECTIDTGMSLSKIESMIGNVIANGGSGDHHRRKLGDDYSLYQSVELFNQGLATWSICRPCIAHDILNDDGSVYAGMCYDDGYYGGDDDYNSYYNYYSNNVDDQVAGGEHCPKGAKWECYDKAGYTNVNQCMKFSAKTVLRAATFRDMAVANLQGTVAKNPLAGYVDTSVDFESKTRQNALTYTFLVSMSLCLIGSLYYLYTVIQEALRSRATSAEMSQTLV